jgi:hypothetical protein
VDEVVAQRGVEHAGGVKLLAGNGGADDGEDAGADDGADAERGKRPRAESLFEPVLGFFRVPDQLIDGFAGKQLAWQGSSPRPFLRAGLGMQAAPVDFGKPYAEVYMMDIGQAEREGFAAGGLE